MNPRTTDTVSELFSSQARALLLYAHQWVDAAVADDVVQRVFVRMLAGGRLPADPTTWLFRCVRNEAISHWRTDRRRDRRERSVAGSSPGWFVPAPDDRIDAASAQAALAMLSPVQREIVTLRIWSGLTLAQVSEVTGVPVSSVHHQYNVALTAMRERLEAKCPNRNL
jgi:RNA polymerase sigma factor (sigma-70 family)